MDKITDEKKQIEAINILKTKGTNAFIKHVFTDKETGKQLTYAEMRDRYG